MSNFSKQKKRKELLKVLEMDPGVIQAIIHAVGVAQSVGVPFDSLIVKDPDGMVSG